MLDIHSPLPGALTPFYAPAANKEKSLVLVDTKCIIRTCVCHKIRAL
jgi:hypothetical protein